MLLKIKDDLVVKIHYKLSDDEGNTLDSSHGEEPLSYIHGYENLVPGLEKALDNKSVGESVSVSVKPAEGYGEFSSELVQEMDREAFKDVEPLEVGMEFHAQGEDGNLQHIEVKAIENDKVTIDGNHPFAGMNLNFEVEILEIREATKEEIDHGHVHDGHHHH